MMNGENHIYNTFTALLNTTMSPPNQNTTNYSQPLSYGPKPSLYMQFFMEACISLPVAVFGIMGNLMALVVLARIRPRQTTNVWLLGLVVGDTMVLILTVLLRSLRYLALYMGILPGYMSIYHWIFIVSWPGVFMTRLAVQWLCVMLTFDRFVAVCRPLHANVVCTLSKTYRHLTAVIIFVILFSLPRFFEYKYEPNTDFHFSPTAFSESNIYTVLYRIIAFSLVNYIIPVSALIIMNRRLVLALRRAENFRGSLRSALGNDHPALATSLSRSVTALVIAVVCLVLTSSSVAFTAQLLYSLEHINRAVFDGPRRFVSLFSNLVVTLNSAINIFIYFYFSRKFRRQLCIMVCPCRNLAMLRCGSNYSSSSFPAYRLRRLRSSVNSFHNSQGSWSWNNSIHSKQRWSDTPSERWSEISVRPQRWSDTTRPTARWSVSSRQSTSGGVCERMLLHRTSSGPTSHGSGPKNMAPRVNVWCLVIKYLNICSWIRLSRGITACNLCLQTVMAISSSG